MTPGDEKVALFVVFDVKHAYGRLAGQDLEQLTEMIAITNESRLILNR